MSTAVAGKGLAGVVAANSGICWIDGDAGVLAYRGIDIHELAEKSTFEESSYLLWFGKLPRRAELDERFEPVPGGGYFVSLFVQHHRHNFAHAWIVVDKKNGCPGKTFHGDLAPG